MGERYALQHPYPSIEGSYGGNQGWFSSRNLQRCACGVVAAGDLLLYLGMYRKGCRTEEMHSLFYPDGNIGKALYIRYLKRLNRLYFPLIPRLGMPSWVLTLGLNAYFLRYKLPLRARWGVMPWNLISRIEEMLKDDIPVILAIGPNIPWIFGKHRLNLYQQGADGKLFPAASVNAHFLTVTACQDEKLTVSSWGKTYVIDWNEYKEYVKKHSLYLASNICYVKSVR